MIFTDAFKIPDLKKGVYLDKVTQINPTDMPSLHSHPYHEIFFMVSGKRRYIIGHNIYIISSGNIAFLPKNILHKTSTVKGKGYERYVLYFFDEDIEELINALDKKTLDDFIGGGVMCFEPDCVETVKDYIRKIEKEKKKNNPVADLYVKNLLKGLILHCVTNGRKKECESGPDADKIQQAAKYISENYSESITLESIAEAVFMEKTYFSKKFKKMTGFGFKEYLILTRIKAAEKLLRETELSLNQISNLCGFSCSNYFGDIFKAYNGVSPKKYRKLFIQDQQ